MLSMLFLNNVGSSFVKESGRLLPAFSEQKRWGAVSVSALLTLCVEVFLSHNTRYINLVCSY